MNHSIKINTVPVHYIDSKGILRSRKCRRNPETFAQRCVNEGATLVAIADSVFYCEHEAYIAAA